MSDSALLLGANSAFVAELYARYRGNPEAVDESWRSFFAALGDEERDLLHELTGASWAPRTLRVITNGAHAAPEAVTAPVEAPPATPQPAAPVSVAPPAPVPIPAALPGADEVRRATLDSIRALMLIRAYRVRGHMHANLDPLGLARRAGHPELDLASYGFGEKDLDRPIFINFVLGMEGATLRQIVDALEQTYCGTIGVEFMHIQEPEQKAWIQERIEGVRNRAHFSDLGRRTILERLTEAESFEHYLDKKYTGTKRFGLDGGESLVPALEQVLKRGAQLGLQEVVLGMAHRGRLNILANILRKPYRAIFSEFQGNPSHPDAMQGSGDVKYHLGTSADREFGDGVVHLSLSANPSHLEAVNTVILGKARAKQAQRGDHDRSQVMGILLHGDAAMAGQGIVAETFGLSQLRDYATGGTIHFIINNQIGFTTNPAQSRSSPYSSDIAKSVTAPILHVNGDDPEAVVHAARIAIEFRQKFKKDVVVDLWCYRRHGHNEADEPSFTQPLMYRRIAELPTTRELYAKRLEVEKILKPGEADALVEKVALTLEQEYEAAASYKSNKTDWLDGRWAGIELASGDARAGETGVEPGVLREIGLAIAEPPAGFNIHPKLVRQLAQRRRIVESGEGIDWSTAEALAFGSLLVEGTPVRLSGEDSGRGTFSQRHAILVDQQTESRYVPLNKIRYGQASIEIVDSPLSEFGVLGFEYGYALAEPHALVMWEAQFGDFANGAQVIIDQFISSGEAKWLRMCGLVLLLPHGYEGQGPEHSSARLERFLQLCAEDNMQVANCTTPSNYFHALRRQVRRNFRKPLILMTPKSLLRHKLCVSKLDEFATGHTFHRLLWDGDEDAPQRQLKSDAQIRRVVLCSGKVYYDLFQARAQAGAWDVYLMRAEQLYPFPRTALQKELKRFTQAELVWAQEEPKNMGAWSFVEPRLEDAMRAAGMKASRPRYVGRKEAAAPATGIFARHQQELAALMAEALAA